MPSATPAPQGLSQGLYDGLHEHDACGVAFVADITGTQSHDVVAMGITALNNLEHRGATGSEENTGDGAGILVQIPDAFFRGAVSFPLPPVGSYAVGIAFLPADDAPAVDEAVAKIGELAAAEGLEVLGWRDVPVDASILGPTARSAMPLMRQLFLRAQTATDVLSLERLAFCLRKRVEHEVGVYFASLSARTITFKGMLTAPQLGDYYADLHDPSFASALALVHSRFSTNTFPSWPLAHPYRYIAHNGEINTVKGNRNWMRAREALLDSPLIPGDLNRLYPIVDPSGSDSASFDEVLELLHLGGRSLPHAVLMMIPEAWENHTEMAPERKAFYQFHASLMEPWDGPACVTFT
ncbi:MAG: glutamate synthase subunit alpha, partial [Pseudonocardiales bacterium]|nr:glutamate synthase subunit alpha [Pseudonocardiales bacterium]